MWYQLNVENSDEIKNESEEAVNLEKKIVLSIVIRLKAEEYMISKINDRARVITIKGNQIMELFKLFKIKCTPNENIVEKLESAILMTLNNIHMF